MRGSLVKENFLIFLNYLPSLLLFFFEELSLLFVRCSSNFSCSSSSLQGTFFSPICFACLSFLFKMKKQENFVELDRFLNNADIMEKM
jgi:hypothetical protein